MLTSSLALIGFVIVLPSVAAHIGAYHKAMFCRNGLSQEDKPNSQEVSNPMYQLSWDEFWFHGKCKDYPPPEGEYLEIPAGGKAVLELANNRAFTSLSYNNTHSSIWADGGDHPDYDDGTWNNSCITVPNMHVENRTRAAGTALAIAYQTDISAVQYEDLVVISVAPETPWHRETEYEIPADLPACDSCICAYSWIPNNCGLSNMYMNGFRCKVTGAKPTARKLAKAQRAKWCEGAPEKCVNGAKGITIYHQQPDINNEDMDGIIQADGEIASPGYNPKTGFLPGAQLDIFEDSGSTSEDTATPTSNSMTTSEPTQSCNNGNTSLSARVLRGHRQHQRRLFSIGPFHLNMGSD